MIKTYKNFPKLNFPLYPLPSCNWIISDKVLFLDGLVLDERNMPGKTLGLRRLQCGRRDLQPLKKVIMDIPGLLRCKKKYFIDIKGNPFIYEKTISSQLSSYKIRKIEGKKTASLLWLHEINYPITIPRPPLNEPQWVRLLHLNGSPWLLYDYVNCKSKLTYRRI